MKKGESAVRAPRDEEVAAVPGDRRAIEKRAVPKGFGKGTGADEFLRAAFGAAYRPRTDGEILAADHGLEWGPTGVRGYWDDDIRFHTSRSLAPRAVPAIGVSPHCHCALRRSLGRKLPKPERGSWRASYFNAETQRRRDAESAEEDSRAETGSPFGNRSRRRARRLAKTRSRPRGG